MSWDASDLCALVVARLDGAELGEWSVYAYGSGPDDAVLVPPPSRTTLLVARGQTGRWFDITVREIRPGADPDAVLGCDADALTALSLRAGLPPPRLW